ncbi:MAG: trypsin-like peptidase domain-containing protein [Terriglobales bacterium]
MKLAAVVLMLALGAVGQEAPKLLVRVALVTKNLDLKPVPMLALRFDPVSGGAAVAATTGFNGRVQLALPRGRYTLVTPQAVNYGGRSYHWVLPVSISGSKQEIDLSNNNAIRAPLPTAPQAPHRSRRPRRLPRPSLAERFAALRTGVVMVWSDAGEGSGFLVGRRGLVLTGDDEIAGSRYVAVQFDARHKVRAEVLAGDEERDIAVLRVNLTAFPGAGALTLASPAEAAAAQPGSKIYALASRLDAGPAVRPLSFSAESPATAPLGSGRDPRRDRSGEPELDVQGHVVAMTTAVGSVPIAEARPVLAQARRGLAADAAPPAALLPVVSLPPFPPVALERAAEQDYNPRNYAFGVGGFTVQLATPPLASWLGGVSPVRGLRDWRRYTSGFAPVVYVFALPKVRATALSLVAHRLVRRVHERKHDRAAFVRMQLLCGGKLVLPIWPGRMRENAGLAGVYKYGPGAFNPDCGTMRLRLYSSIGKAVKEKRLNPKLVRRIWNDFAPWRQAAAGSG